VHDLAGLRHPLHERELDVLHVPHDRRLHPPGTIGAE
jgi:hypothetical protein